MTEGYVIAYLVRSHRISPLNQTFSVIPGSFGHTRIFRLHSGYLSHTRIFWSYPGYLSHTRIFRSHSGYLSHTRIFLSYQLFSVIPDSLRHTRLDRVSYVLMQDFMLFCRSSFWLYYRDTCAEFCLKVATSNVKFYEIT